MMNLKEGNNEFRIFVDENNIITGTNLLFRVSKMKYLKDLQDGKFYINKLSFFRKYEKEGIGDKEEGLLVYCKTATMSVNGMKFADIKDLRAYTADDNPVFCFGSVPIKEVSPGNYEYVFDKKIFTDFIEEPDEEYGIMFVFEDALVNLLERRMKELNLAWCWARVTYVDQRPIIKPDEWYKVAFYKRKHFAHQNEVRLFLFTTVEDHYDLVIDSLVEHSKIFPITNDSTDLKIEFKLNNAGKTGW